MIYTMPLATIGSFASAQQNALDKFVHYHVGYRFLRIAIQNRRKYRAWILIHIDKQMNFRFHALFVSNFQ